MSQQLAITNFFKSKSHPSPTIGKNMDTGKRKKRNLSLTRISSTVSPKNRKIEVEISILSDDDDFCTPIKSKPLNLSQSSNDSEKTIIYSPSPKKALQTPNKTTKSTPRASSSSKTQTPSAKDRFFSPTKNRSVKKRTPVKSKRNLTKELTGNGDSVEKTVHDACFEFACEGMDDKTVFLLQIINTYLKDNTLKPLLNNGAQQLFQSSQSVAKPGMKLVCRLFWRKGGWFQRKQILDIVSEDNIPLDEASFDTMIHSLAQRAWLRQSNNCMTFEELSSLLKAEELKLICKDLKLKGGTKQEAIDSLRSYSRRTSNICSYFSNGKTSDNTGRVLRIMQEKAGPCYKLSDGGRTALNQLYVLMYLGMDFSLIWEKKFELALIHDKIKRETYPVNQDIVLENASVVFESNQEFERYMAAHNVYEDFMNETCSDEKSALVDQIYQVYKAIGDEEMLRYKSLPSWLRRFTPAHLYIRILDTGIQDLKKVKNVESYELALQILTDLIGQTAFRQHKKADWYAEKALILHSLLGRCDEAAEVLIEGFKSNLSEEEKDKMRNRATRIARQKSVKVSEHLKRELLDLASKDTILEKNLNAEHIYKQPMENITKGKSRFETKTSEGRVIQSVEEYCITHCISTGDFTHGEHWEGRIVTTMFFLLFWDIIYSKPRGVRGIFLSHFQVYPLDLFTDSFYENRRALIDDRLRLIENSTEEEVLTMMEDTWKNRPEYEISGINRNISWEALSAVARCAGARALAALCARLARRYRHAHSGFPDVTLWNVHTKQVSHTTYTDYKAVSAVARCAGARALAALCARLARRYRHAHSGFPDVTLWNVHTKQVSHTTYTDYKAVSAVARCAGARALAALCARLARRYRHAHSGFPDVTLWNVHTKQVSHTTYTDYKAVSAVARCAGARALAALCARLARRYRHAHSGFPDVTLWNVHTKQVSHTTYTDYKAVSAVARCAGARALAALCARLARRYRHAHSGFPDVTLWNVHTKQVSHTTYTDYKAVSAVARCAGARALAALCARLARRYRHAHSGFPDVTLWNVHTKQVSHTTYTDYKAVSAVARCAGARALAALCARLARRYRHAHSGFPDVTLWNVHTKQVSHTTYTDYKAVSAVARCAGARALAALCARLARRYRHAHSGFPDVTLWNVHTKQVSHTTYTDYKAVSAVARCAGARALAALCARLARRYRHAHSGFPDVTLWNVHTKQVSHTTYTDYKAVSAVARCAGARALAALCARLARRYRHAHSGFPDVTLWNVHTKQVSHTTYTDYKAVSAVARCAGARALAALCARLARRYRHAHSGFPDVTLWNVHTKQVSHTTYTDYKAVSAVARCAGARALAALCARLARRYRHAHSGFPDVTLWNVHTKQVSHTTYTDYKAVSAVARCAGARALAALCARLARRYRHAHSGFPDVTLWNVHTKQVSHTTYTDYKAVSAVARCAGARALAALCARLARRYRHAHSGFPDVTLWNVHTKQIKFVEVKSDSDHPSMKQIQWMNYLREHGIDTGLCYVGANTTRQRARAGNKSP